MGNEQLRINLNPEAMRVLEQGWSALIRSFNPHVEELQAARVFRDLTARYSEPARFYHGLPHVNDLLLLGKEHESTLENPGLVNLSFWLHDAIYDPTSKTNEEDSEAYAREILPDLGVSSLITDQTGGFILASKTHVLPPDQNDNTDLAFFIDADLSILAADPVRYELYLQQIRREYLHMDVAAGRQRRVNFLRGMLGRDRIFVSTQLAHLEEQARQNMERELSSISVL